MMDIWRHGDHLAGDHAAGRRRRTHGQHRPGRYWRNPAATQASFVDGYWKSADIGSVDAEDFVRIADRKKDMINRGGFKVYPAEVENVLCDQDGVVEAAVIGQPDAILGERAVACVHASVALSPDAVRAFCAARMADYKVPDRVLVCHEPLPRNASGKIQKEQLRRQAAQDLAGAPGPGAGPALKDRLALLPQGHSAT